MKQSRAAIIKKEVWSICQIASFHSSSVHAKEWVVSSWFDKYLYAATLGLQEPIKTIVFGFNPIKYLVSSPWFFAWFYNELVPDSMQSWV